jgi:hypothetical protein
VVRGELGEKAVLEAEREMYSKEERIRKLLPRAQI